MKRFLSLFAVIAIGFSGNAGELKQDYYSSYIEELKALVKLLKIRSDIEFAKQQIIVHRAVAKEDLRLGATTVVPQSLWAKFFEDVHAKRLRENYWAERKLAEDWEVLLKSFECNLKAVDASESTEEQIYKKIQKLGPYHGQDAKTLASIETDIHRWFKSNWAGIAGDWYNGPTERGISRGEASCRGVDPVVGVFPYARNFVTSVVHYRNLAGMCEPYSMSGKQGPEFITAGGCGAFKEAGEKNKKQKEFVENVALSFARAAASGTMKDADALLPIKEPVIPFCYVLNSGRKYSAAVGRHIIATFDQMSLSLVDRQRAAAREVVNTFRAGKCELHPTYSTRPIQETAWRDFKE